MTTHRTLAGRRLHFSGIAGSGMSALAQFAAMSGATVGGSDRSFDSGGGDDIRAALERLGIAIVPQDGSGPGSGCDTVIVSTAVEETVADIRVARERGIPIQHRSELLARFVRERRTVAVAGTSGKSTVTAMLFEILAGAGLDPSVITGGELLRLRDKGLLGNCHVGRSEWLVIEADESDGSLLQYEPWAGVLLNLHRDHKEPRELAEIFAAFRNRTRGPFLTADDANLDAFSHGAIRFGLSARCAVRAAGIELEPSCSRFALEQDQDAAPARAACTLPAPGLHNVRNALAAAAAALVCGVPLADSARALGGYRGVARRFQTAGTAGGCEVIDDFAHNPEKIRASLDAARRRATRILAVFQPHGFGPTRFLREGLIAALSEGLRGDDRLYMPEIFYAGGTASRDISSRDIVEAVAALGVPSCFRERRDDLVDLIASEARAGDLVLVMGARDPSLTKFCRDILRRIEDRVQDGTRKEGC